jgi:23S rRNA (cytidine1920-2'-O)/16S rRNA (cytidine1409-2'-O)-methyltransferase
MRLDKLIVERNLARTRSLAQRHIAAGRVSVDGTLVTKAAFPVETYQDIVVTPETSAFASRGGQKLAAALDHWKIDLHGRVCLDIGISTGGFADSMLKRGAAQVIGVDSGHSQLAEALRTEPRLRLLERTNARYLTPSMLPESIGFLTVDVSFIAASLVLPAVIASAFPRRQEEGSASSREAVVLVKPQFEAGRQFVGKGGIVRNASAHRIAIERVREVAIAHGAQGIDVMDSPILGGDGNREFLLYARF